MMKKIVFIQPIPLTSVKERMFYIQGLRNYGFDTEFWNLSPFRFPNLHLEGQIKPEYNVNVASFSQFELLLEQADIDNTIFIADLDEGWANAKLLLKLKQKKCLLVRLYIHTAIGCNQFTLWQNFAYLSLRNPITALKYAIRGIQYKWMMYRRGFFKNPYLLFISSGSNPHIDIPVNHYDWEQFKQASNEPAEIEGKYAVFIDQYFPLHPEFLKFCTVDRKHTDQVDHYQAQMCRLFDHLEKDYGVEVVIAAHPQAQYGPESFNGRKIVKFRTAHLVSHAEQVIIHGSAALGYAVMADKPLVLVATDHYLSFKNVRKHIESLSRYFRLPIYNLDHDPLNSIDIRKVSLSCREKYIYRYLTSKGIEDKCTLDILCQVLSEI